MPPVELYNLVEDPEESRNLAEALPEVVAALTARMEDWVSMREAAIAGIAPIRYTTKPGWH